MLKSKCNSPVIFIMFKLGSRIWEAVNLKFDYNKSMDF